MGGRHATRELKKHLLAVTEALWAPLTGRVHGALAKAIAYLRFKQSSTGGFCFYKCEYLDEPNLYDTYHAISALSLAGVEVPCADAVAEFLNGLPVAGIEALFHYAFALDQLGRSSLIHPATLKQIRDLPVEPHPPRGGIAMSSWLEHTLMSVRLKKRFAHDYPEEAAVVPLVRNLKTRGRYGDKPNLLDTCWALGILAALGDSLAADDETRVFVDSLQRPSIGFTPTADSLQGTLDVIDAGVQCCAMLNVPVRFRDDIVAFVLACQTADGAFARAPDALPDIALTHRALAIIRRTGPGMGLSYSEPSAVHYS